MQSANDTVNDIAYDTVDDMMGSTAGRIAESRILDSSAKDRKRIALWTTQLARDGG